MFGWRTKYDGNFVPMTRSIGFPVAFGQIDEPPGRRVRKNFSLRVPLVRNADEFGLISVHAQLPMQRADEVLGATMHERNLDFADDDALNAH